MLLLACADDSARLDTIEARLDSIEALRAADVREDDLRRLEAAVTALEGPVNAPGPKRVIPTISAMQTQRCLTDVAELVQRAAGSWEEGRVEEGHLGCANTDCHADVVLRVSPSRAVFSAELAVARGPRTGERFVVTATSIDRAPDVPVADLVETNGWRASSP